MDAEARSRISECRARGERRPTAATTRDPLTPQAVTPGPWPLWTATSSAPSTVPLMPWAIAQAGCPAGIVSLKRSGVHMHELAIKDWLVAHRLVQEGAVLVIGRMTPSVALAWMSRTTCGAARRIGHAETTCETNGAVRLKRRRLTATCPR
jgi:hypothetical protein